MRHRWVVGGVALLPLITFVLLGIQQRTPVPQSASTAAPTPHALSANPSPTTSERVLGEHAPSNDRGTVETVIDGDTFRLTDGRVVRLIGIDAPETGTRGTRECFADEATTGARELLAGKSVELTTDVSETDRYGRILRYVYVGELFANEALVRDGYATAYRYPPDVRHAERLRQAEREARAARRGLWGASCAHAAASPADDKDCTDFPTRAAAQEFFLAHGGPQNDPHKLDVDRDGIVCESLR